MRELTSSPVDSIVGYIVRGGNRIISPSECVEIMAGASRWHNIYDIEQWRRGECIKRQREVNLVTTEGRRYMADITMKGQTDEYTLVTAWYIGLVATNTTPDAGNDYDNLGQGGIHPTEFTTFKTPTTTRQQWVGTMDGSLASLTNNTSKASFTIDTVAPSTYVYGAFLCTNSTLGDHTQGSSPKTNALMSYSLFTSPLEVAEDDIVKVGITITIPT